MSPFSTTRLDASWNQGFVRGPEARIWVSIHSPARAMLPAWSIAQICRSVIPGCICCCMSYMAAWQAWAEQRIALISSGPLILRACSMSSVPFSMVQPARSNSL